MNILIDELIKGTKNNKIKWKRVDTGERLVVESEYKYKKIKLTVYLDYQAKQKIYSLSEKKGLFNSYYLQINGYTNEQIKSLYDVVFEQEQVNLVKNITRGIR